MKLTESIVFEFMQSIRISLKGSLLGVKYSAFTKNLTTCLANSESRLNQPRIDSIFIVEGLKQTPKQHFKTSYTRDLNITVLLFNQIKSENCIVGNIDILTNL